VNTPYRCLGDVEAGPDEAHSAVKLIAGLAALASLTALTEANSCASAIFIDEFDAGAFKRPAHCQIVRDRH
jgi:hypothetical protein